MEKIGHDLAIALFHVWLFGAKLANFLETGRPLIF
jgi:hypothetical protein